MKTSTLVRNGVSTETVELILRLIKLIPWPERRGAIGDVAVSLLDGKKRVAQTVFGWNRHTVEVGIHEFQTGIVCINDITTRFKPRSENKDPKLLADIQAIMEPHSESDLSLRTTLLYSNMTAKMVHGALIQKGWSAESLPKVRTISNILNRQSYRLRTVAKTKVQKKTAETDAIFENVRRVNAQADADPQTLRISIDTKATVHVGEYSRSGRSRGVVAVKANDHDMGVKEKLVPGGILEPVSGKSFLFFGTNYKTSDFMADGLVLWWTLIGQYLFGLKMLVINVDNGPECSGRRSQFLLRMVEFADMTGLCIRLVYYPPYHSKYNAIERYWAGLEKSWNGYLLSTVDTVLNRAGNFHWKGKRTTVRLQSGNYKKGVKVIGEAKKTLIARLERSTELSCWDITIRPKVALQ